MKKLNERGMCYVSGYLGIRDQEIYDEGFMSGSDRAAFREEYEGKRAAIEETRKWIFAHREGITADAYYDEGNSVDDFESHMEHLTMMMNKSTMFKDGYLEGFRSAARFMRWAIKAFGEDM